MTGASSIAAGSFAVASSPFTLTLQHVASTVVFLDVAIRRAMSAALRSVLTVAEDAVLPSTAAA